MSLFAVVVLVVVAGQMVPARWRIPAVATAIAAGLVGLPVAMLGVGGWRGSLVVKRRSERRHGRRAAETEVIDLARFLLVGAGAGWSLDESLRLARQQLVTSLGEEVDEVLRKGRVDGLATSLAISDGVGVRLFRMLARSHLGGVPLDRALSAFVREAVDRRRGDLTERARRLPIRMVVPLTLLMLPGFVLLVAGPAVLITARRLLAPFVT